MSCFRVPHPVETWDVHASCITGLGRWAPQSNAVKRFATMKLQQFAIKNAAMYGAPACETQCCQMVYFQTKNSILGKFWGVEQKKDVGKFYGHFDYFTANWYILWSFGIFCGLLVYFHLLVCCTKKNLATLVRQAV
jgi:hypothetical protein